jgi:hypothetical protein
MDRVRQAHHNASWEGGEHFILVDKVNVVEPTKEDNGLINHCNCACVSFKAEQSSAIWNFGADAAQRKQRWAVNTTKQKCVDSLGQIINIAEQPVQLDAKALTHYSNPGDWIFVDGFGSGTSFLAALCEGRNMVGTEPDSEQFSAAVERVTRAIAAQISADHKAAERARVREEKEFVSSQQSSAKTEALSLKKRKRNKPEESKDDMKVPFSFFAYFLGDAGKHP